MPVCICLSIPFKTKSINWSRQMSVEWFVLKPDWYMQTSFFFIKVVFRGGSRTAATSKMECFVIIVNGLKPLTIITKHSILDVAAALDPPLVFNLKVNWFFNYFWYFYFYLIVVLISLLSFSKEEPSALSLRNFTGILSIPAALLVSWLKKIFLITSSDTFDNSKSLDTLH